MYRIGERREPQSRIEVRLWVRAPHHSYTERFPYNTTDFIFLAFTLCLRFGLLSFTVVKKEKLDESKRETLLMGRYRSGQTGQTVNLLAYAFGGSNPSLPTRKR